LKRKVELSASAVSALAQMDKVHRKFVLDGIRLHLMDNEPLEISRNKFPSRRPSPHAEWELRIEPWRVFYSVSDNGSLVLISMIGEKRGNKLFIEGEEFEL
jgi:mRNA-degrading endonuclease RelE of RelBE toxin-antitoxin system